MITHNFTETLPGGTQFTMLPIAGGNFMMGSDKHHDREKPVHRVQVPDFYLCQHAVTQAVWEAIMGNNPSYFQHPKRPVEQVSWLDAQAFIAQLNAWVQENPFDNRPSGHYCLPSEAQWEYAARGGQQSEGFLYAGSDDLGEVGYYEDNSAGITRYVGELYPNELGLYDMSGNIFEWCQDEWHDNYKGAPLNGSAWERKNIEKEDTLRVVRGWSWFNSPDYCRVSYRDNDYAYNSVNDIGLRLCFNLS